MDAKEASIYTAVLITCMIVFILVVSFTIAVIKYQRRTIKLYKAKVLAEIRTLEQERKRISADLHDEVGPIIVGIKLKLDSLELHSEDDIRTLVSVRRNIRELIGKMNDISNDLMPVLLTKKGLVVMMERFVEEINQSEIFHVVFYEENVSPLPESISINLYRILNEIVHNCIKHSEASLLKIDMKMERKILTLTAKDNGKGFDYKLATKEHVGLGLRNLLNRTEVMNGKMYVDSVIGKGTSYLFEIPIHEI